jgi:gamma-glutamyl-gamma-aminobutyrate hydrolase PuuD
MKPLIGITTNQSTNAYGQPTIMLMQSYVNAVMQAGGVPVLIPSLIAEDGSDVIYSHLDGMIRIPASMMWTLHVIPLN